MGLLLLKLNTGRKVGPQLYIKLITTEGENRVHETLHTYSESAPLGAAPKTARQLPGDGGPPRQVLTVVTAAPF